jgi:hypothetical protein
LSPANKSGDAGGGHKARRYAGLANDDLLDAMFDVPNVDFWDNL